MARIMLDTDLYSYVTSSNPSFITVGELYAGYRKKIHKGEWPASHLARLESRLKLLVIIPYDVEVCKAYGDLKATIKTPLGTDRVIGANDLWIAACSVRHSLKLVTNNRKDFEDIPGLNIVCEAPRRR